MIYLDYAADTPVREEVLDVFMSVARKHFANPNATHKMGNEAKRLLDTLTADIARDLGVLPQEIIYTSGATESNNLAIKGIAEQYGRKGKHIITTYLEHSSVTGPISYLQNKGFEVEFVDILPSGLVDLAHLKTLLRPDTILVSIAYVDSELGIQQDIEAVRTLVKEHTNAFLHVDATQAIGKISIDLRGIDLVTLTGHKLYGLHGIGLLIKKDSIFLEPVIHGGLSTTPFRSGTPTVALVAAMQKALALAMQEQAQHLAYVTALNKQIREALGKYNQVEINSTAHSIPYILNISLKGIKIAAFHTSLEEKGIFVSTKSACTSPNTPSRPVMVLTKDRKRAMTTLRISLSHLTTQEEITTFLTQFDACYEEFY